MLEHQCGAVCGQSLSTTKPFSTLLSFISPLLLSRCRLIGASANLPVIIYTIYWKRFNSNGAVWAIIGGLITALVMVAVSPNVWNPEPGKAIFVGTPLVTLTNPAIISVPVGFICGWLGTILSREADVVKYNEVEVRAQTGISVNEVSH